MYSHNQMNEELIKQRIIEQVDDPEHFKQITNSTLEGLAERELNLSAIVGKSAEARERRLVPEVIEDFFLQAAPISGLSPKAIRADAHQYRHSPIASGEKLRKFVVARGGIEPPTRGFSVPCR
jgi:hypothetical protein